MEAGGIKAPKPLTEAQRNEVRTMLRQLSQSSASRRSKTGKNKNPLSRRRAKKVKRIENPFDGIDEGKSVNGFTELSHDCCTLTFVQRCRITLLPFHYDRLTQTYVEWRDMVVHYCGCEPSIIDNETKEHIKFVVEGNAPVKYLHVYLEPTEMGSEQYLLSNFIFAT